MFSLSAQSNGSQFTDKIKTAFSDYWWIVVIAFAALLLLFIIVAACKSGKIRKLKKQNAELREKLEEADKPQEEKEDVFAPVTGGKQLFGIEAEKQPEEVKEQPKEAVEPVRPAVRQDVRVERIDDIEPASKNANIKFRVLFDRAGNSWVIKKDGSDRVVRRLATKEEAMVTAKSLCKKHNAELVVHKKDGKFQRQ